MAEASQRGGAPTILTSDATARAGTQSLLRGDERRVDVPGPQLPDGRRPDRPVAEARRVEDEELRRVAGRVRHERKHPALAVVGVRAGHVVRLRDDAVVVRLPDLLFVRNEVVLRQRVEGKPAVGPDAGGAEDRAVRQAVAQRMEVGMSSFRSDSRVISRSSPVAASATIRLASARRSHETRGWGQNYVEAHRISETAVALEEQDVRD